MASTSTYLNYYPLRTDIRCEHRLLGCIECRQHFGASSVRYLLSLNRPVGGGTPIHFRRFASGNSSHMGVTVFYGILPRPCFSWHGHGAFMGLEFPLVNVGRNCPATNRRAGRGNVSRLTCPRCLVPVMARRESQAIRLPGLSQSAAPLLQRV
jgi:hypothetical protein